MKKTYLIILMAILLCYSVLSETIIIDDPVVDDINDTIDNNNETELNLSNFTNSTLAYVIDDEVKHLIKELLAEKQYLAALEKRFTDSEGDFINTINKTSTTIELLLLELSTMREENKALQYNMTIRIETLTTDFRNIERDYYMFKAKSVVVYIAVIVLVICITLAIVSLKKGKRWYFFVRWVRDRIPIKF